LAASAPRDVPGPFDFAVLETRLPTLNMIIADELSIVA